MVPQTFEGTWDDIAIKHDDELRGHRVIVRVLDEAENEKKIWNRSAESGISEYKKATMTLKIIIEPGEDFGFVAHVPTLLGCHTQGKTREEALANAREAIALWLEVEQDKVEGQPQLA